MINLNVNELKNIYFFMLPKNEISYSSENILLIELRENYDFGLSLFP